MAKFGFGAKPINPIYGCNVAESANRQALLNQLSELTGTDVAASEDLTGHADLAACPDTVATLVKSFGRPQKTLPKVLTTFATTLYPDTLLGGDYDLEFQVGDLESEIILGRHRYRC